MYAAFMLPLLSCYQKPFNMIKIFTISLLLLHQVCNAQYIHNMYITPSNPSIGDNITFYADISFNSGSCYEKVQNHSLNGNTIYAYALHCLGPLAYICDHTDTFNLGSFAPGNYMVIFMVDNGYLPSPCTPGIVAGPSDTLLFTVDNTTSITESSMEHFNAYFSNNTLEVDATTNEAYSVFLYSATGSLVSKIMNASNAISIPFTGYGEGIYIVSIQNENGIYRKKIIYRM